MVDRGESTAALELASTLQQFGGMVADYGIKQQTARGAQEGTVAGASGQPNFQKGWRTMTAYGQAYNNAATRSYAIRAEADAEDQAARLEVDAANDPAKFEATFGAIAKATIKAAPPEARAILTEVYNQRMATGRMRLINAQATEQHNQARGDLAEGIQRSTDRIAQWRASDDPALMAQADTEEAKLGLLIDSAARDGTISETARLAAHKNSMEQTFADTIVARLEKEMSSPTGDPIGFIQRFDEASKASNVLSPDEEQKLHSRLMTKLEDRARMDRLAEAGANAEQAARYAAGDREGTARLLDGSLTNSWILDKTLSGDLKPEIARTLRDALKSGSGGPVSDSRELLIVEPNLLSFSETDILKNGRLSNDDKRRLILKRQEMVKGWQGTPAAREASRILTRGLGIQEGKNVRLLSDDEVQQLSDAQNEMYVRGEAMKPEERDAGIVPLARELVNKYHLRTTTSEADTVGANAAKLEAVAADPNKSKYDRDTAAKLAASQREREKQLRAEAARLSAGGGR